MPCPAPWPRCMPCPAPWPRCMPCPALPHGHAACPALPCPAGPISGPISPNPRLSMPHIKWARFSTQPRREFAPYRRIGLSPYQTRLARNRASTGPSGACETLSPYYERITDSAFAYGLRCNVLSLDASGLCLCPDPCHALPHGHAACPALPCPALPHGPAACPALPCPALPHGHAACPALPHGHAACPALPCLMASLPCPALP
jgi:hypothetical protein